MKRILVGLLCGRRPRRDRGVRCGQWRRRGRRCRRQTRPDHHLALQQRRGGRLGQAMVEAWNADHPDEQVTAQEIPAGKTSEEVIGAAITAGNAPCLIFNTAPAAVPQFQKPGGLVPLDDFADGAPYIEDAHRRHRRAVPVRRRQVLPDAVEVQPGDDLLQQGDVHRRPGSTPRTRRCRRTTSSWTTVAQDRRVQARASTRSARRRRASSSSPGSTSTRCTPPRPAASSSSRTARRTFDVRRGRRGSPTFWATLYDEGLAPQEKYNGDAFADGKAAMAIVGPWAIAVYERQGRLGRRCRCRPRRARPPSETHTFSDAKNVAMFTACENRGTAWDVLKFATSEEQDGALLEATGQMPLRTDLTDAYPDYFAENPATSCSPTRPPAPSRCRTCRTRSRSGRRSATRTPSR